MAMFTCPTCGAKTNYAQCQSCWLKRREALIVSEAEVLAAQETARVVSSIELTDEDRDFLRVLAIGWDGGAPQAVAK